MLLQLLINGIILGSIYSLVSLGFALVYNTTRIFHIAYAGLYTFAAYMLFTFYNLLNFHLIVSFVIAVILTSIISVLIEKVVYLPLEQKRSSLNIILISSIGIMIIIINVIAMIYGNETQIVNPNISESYNFGEIIITQAQLVQFFVSLIFIITFLIFLKYTNFGIKTRAMRDDPILCMLFGLHLNKMRIILFILSACFVAISSGLIAYDSGMDPYVGMPMLLNAVVALIIGGSGRFESPILGGFIIGILQSLVVWGFSSRWQDAVTFMLLIIFLLIRPQGIIGEKQRVV